MTEEAKKQIEEAHNLNDINVFMTDSTTLKILLNYIDKLQKENELLKAPFEYAKRNTLDKRYVELNFISKDKIREFIEKELPDDDLMEACSIVDVNGIVIREELEKIIRGE